MALFGMEIALVRKVKNIRICLNRHEHCNLSPSCGEGISVLAWDLSAFRVRKDEIHHKE